MRIPPTGRGAHARHCDSDMCCRCQTRPHVTAVGPERLCGLCASCCTACGALPSREAGGLAGGVCARCRGICGLCQGPLNEHARCERCHGWKASPTGDPVLFVLQGVPEPLVRRTRGSFSAQVHELVRHQLTVRTPGELLDRIERRWYAHWSLAQGAVDEESGRPRTPDDIVLRLVAPPACTDPHCEDGHLRGGGGPCPRCNTPKNRFAPGEGLQARPEVVDDALAAMRASVRGSHRRTTPAPVRRRTTPAAAADERLREQADEALALARARRDAPAARAREAVAGPPPAPEGPEEPEDPVREAALKRARAERGVPPRR